MSFESSSDMYKLQKLVKSSLLEINKLKMEIVELKEEQSSLKSNDEFETLTEDRLKELAAMGDILARITERKIPSIINKKAILSLKS